MYKIALAFLVILVLYCSCKDAPKRLPESSRYFDSVITVAEHMYDAGDRARALAFVTAAHANAHDLLLMDDLNYYVYCAEIYRKDYKDYDRYIGYADSMLLLLDKRNATGELPNKVTQAYNMKADGLFSKGMYIASYDYYYKAKALAGETADSCSLSQYSYSLGMVLYRQRRFLEAAAHFRESYNESSACKDMFIFFYHRQEILDNIGLCYAGAQKYDSAMCYYTRDLAYIDTNAHRFEKGESMYLSAKAVVYGNMADVYVAMGNYDTAKVLLKKSIDINLRKGYANTDALISQVKLADIDRQQVGLAEMSELLQQIKVELDTIPDNDQRAARTWNKLMWQYYDRRQDPVSAYKYLAVYERMNDSFAARNKLLMATDADEQVKNIEKQNHIDLLKKNNEHERVYRIIATVIAVMAIIIIFLVIRSGKKTMKNLRTLTKLNNEVNEQKEKLQIALTELEWKDKDRDRILRSVAHDVMNPIAAIMAFIDILQTGPEEYNDDQKEIFELMKEACTNSLSLSRDILEAAVEHTTMTKEWVDMNKLAASSVELHNFRSLAKKQRLLVTANEESIQAFVNKEKIWRVINNLLGNAIKFSHEGSEILVNIAHVGDKVDISVKDNGIGIPEKNKPFVFDMFTDVKVPGTSGERPHGLGLSISLQIAKAHYGTIRFESEEGKGATFHLVLPVNMQA